MEKEQYENIIELLKRTLKFYSDADNYTQNKDVNSELTSMIELDQGKQAHQILKQVDELMKQDKNAKEDYSKLLENTENPKETSRRIMVELKKLRDGN